MPCGEDDAQFVLPVCRFHGDDGSSSHEVETFEDFMPALEKDHVERKKRKWTKNKRASELKPTSSGKR